MKNLFLLVITVFTFSFGNAQTNYLPTLKSLIQSSNQNFEDILGEKLSSQGYVSTHNSKTKFGVGKEFIDKMPKNTLGNIFTLVSSGKSSEGLEMQIIDYVKENFVGDQYLISLDQDEKTGYYSLIIMKKSTTRIFLMADKKLNSTSNTDEYQLKIYGQE